MYVSIRFKRWLYNNASSGLVQLLGVCAVIDKDDKVCGSLPMLMFSVKRGLLGITIEYMKLILTIIPRKCERLPTSEKGLFTEIFNTLFEGATQDDIDTAWDFRNAKIHESAANLADNVDLFTGVLCEDDLAAVSRVVEEHREGLKKGARDGTRPTRAGLRTALREDDIPISNARALVPPGCKLDKGTTLHWRWKGSMTSRVKGPRVISKAWGGKSGVSEVNALGFVLRGLWDWASLPPYNMTCPFDLSDLS